MSGPEAGAREQLGWLLDHLGRALFPLSIGLVIGFWASDLGMRWLPGMLTSALGVGLAALLFMAGGRYLRGEAYALEGRELRTRRRVVAALALCLLLSAVRLGVFWAEQPSALTQLEDEAFEQAFAVDLRRYQDYDRQMELLVSRLEAEPFLAEPNDAVLTPEQERLLTLAWGSLYDQAFALDQIRVYYEDWFRFDPSRAQRSQHTRSFLLTFAAELALYEKAARFSQLALANPNVKKFLDTPHPSLDLSADSFSQLRSELLGARDQSRIVAGEQYLTVLEDLLRVPKEGTVLALWARVDDHLATIDRVAPLDRVNLAARADAQLLKRGLRRVWFPTRKGVARWMGDVRLRRIGWYLITPEQVAEMDPSLAPGDVMLSRKNWYLSNVGLPGFWPHALLYIGDPEKLSAWADDPEIDAWASQVAGEPMGLVELIERDFPTHWRDYRAGDHGQHLRVIEAISEGVVLNTLEHAAGDYLGAVRPRVSKAARARAIYESFSYLDRPYDWDFDFATDHALVCSEVVWRAYRPGEDREGIEMPLTEVVGRLNLPPSDIAQLFDEQRGQEDRIFDFVYFLDAIEHEQRAVVATEEAFAGTWRRPKWDVMQE